MAEKTRIDAAGKSSAGDPVYQATFKGVNPDTVSRCPTSTLKIEMSAVDFSKLEALKEKLYGADEKTAQSVTIDMNGINKANPYVPEINMDYKDLFKAMVQIRSDEPNTLRIESNSCSVSDEKLNQIARAKAVRLNLKPGSW